MKTITCPECNIVHDIRDRQQFTCICGAFLDNTFGAWYCRVSKTKKYNNKSLMDRYNIPELTYGEVAESREKLKEFLDNETAKAIRTEVSKTFDPNKTKPTRGDGGATSYYELPKGATELKHLIRHKEMSHAIGEAFCALYRLKDNDEYVRNLKKAKYYIDSELEYLSD